MKLHHVICCWAAYVFYLPFLKGLHASRTTLKSGGKTAVDHSHPEARILIITAQKPNSRVMYIQNQVTLYTCLLQLFCINVISL